MRPCCRVSTCLNEFPPGQCLLRVSLTPSLPPSSYNSLWTVLGFVCFDFKWRRWLCHGCDLIILRIFLYLSSACVSFNVFSTSSSSLFWFEDMAVVVQAFRYWDLKVLMIFLFFCYQFMCLYSVLLLPLFGTVYFTVESIAVQVFNSRYLKLLWIFLFVSDFVSVNLLSITSTTILLSYEQIQCFIYTSIHPSARQFSSFSPLPQVLSLSPFLLLGPRAVTHPRSPRGSGHHPITAVGVAIDQ